MPLKVMKSFTSHTKSPTIPAQALPPSRSNSGSSSNTAAHQAECAASLRSTSSSEDSTLHTQHSHFNSKEDSLPTYSDEKGMFTRYFEKEGQRMSQEFNPFDAANVSHGLPGASSSSSRLPTSKMGKQLAAALGPDNSPHSMEIDSIPCAGVRIRHGPLSGLLGWRLVVRIPEGQGTLWWEADVKASRKRRRGSLAPTALLPPPPHKPAHSHSYSEWNSPKGSKLAETLVNSSASLSSSSLPLPQFPTLPRHRSHDAVAQTAPQNPMPLVANFILDTSLPYSLISRDTVLALGYPHSHLPSAADPNDLSEDPDDAPTVTLSIQGVTTRLRFANPGEPSRLGVQFLQDAGVSVFFPKDGDGVGPVLYLESARIMHDVPTTLPHGARGSRLSLQQRVRILFGMAS